VAEQPGLNVFDPQRLAQQRVLKQVDLADGEVVSGAPVGVDALQLSAERGLLDSASPVSCTTATLLGEARRG
jgi:hypothetical protein